MNEEFYDSERFKENFGLTDTEFKLHKLEALRKLIKHKGEVRDDSDSENSTDSETRLMRKKANARRAYLDKTEQYCMEAVRQYRWAMLEASRHLDMEKGQVRRENAAIKRERLKELKKVQERIYELETGKTRKSRKFSKAFNIRRKSTHAT